MKDEAFHRYREYLGARVLNIGSAGNLEKNRDGVEFVNLDRNPATGAQVVHDLYNLPLPIMDNSFDAVVGSHIFEHIEKKHFLPLVAELHRILKPNGHLLAFTPYGTSFDAWENPFHVQCFTEVTWYYVLPELYKMDNAGYGADEGMPLRNWRVVNINLVVRPEFVSDPEIEFKKLHYLNVIQELQVILKAVK